MYDTSEQYANDITTFSFNILFGLVYDKCYPLYTKTTLVLFLFWLLLIQQFFTNQNF